MPPKVERCSPGLRQSAISGAGDGGAEREAVGDPLGQDHDVRLDAEVLDGEDLAGAPEARLHLVGDEEDAVAVEDLLHPPEVARRRHEDAALAPSPARR